MYWHELDSRGIKRCRFICLRRFIFDRMWMEAGVRWIIERDSTQHKCKSAHHCWCCSITPHRNWWSDKSSTTWETDLRGAILKIKRNLMEFISVSYSEMLGPEMNHCQTCQSIHFSNTLLLKGNFPHILIVCCRSSTTWWPNLWLMQIAPQAGQNLN